MFESRDFGFENSTNITLSGNRETCPLCGAMADVMDGTFDFLAGVIHVLSAPQVTLDRLRGLRTLVQQTPPEQVLDAIKEAAPELAEALTPFLPKDPAKLATWIAVVLAALTVLVGLKQIQVSEHPPAPIEQQAPNVLNRQQVEDIIQAVIASQHSSQQQPPPGQPPSPPTLRTGPRTPQQPPATTRRPVAPNKRYTPPKRHG